MYNASMCKLKSNHDENKKGSDENKMDPIPLPEKDIFCNFSSFTRFPCKRIDISTKHLVQRTYSLRPSSKTPALAAPQELTQALT